MRITDATRAVVAGAGSGLGRAFAKALVSRGAVVVASDISEEAARETAAAIVEAGGRGRMPSVVTLPTAPMSLGLRSRRRTRRFDWWPFWSAAGPSLASGDDPTH